MCAEIKRMLSEIDKKMAAAQANRKLLFVESEKLTFVLINAMRTKIETKGANSV